MPHDPLEGLVYRVGPLEWKRFGELRLGIKGQQIMALITPGDDTFPVKVFAVTYPDHLFLEVNAAITLADAHARCVDHGIEGCGLCIQAERPDTADAQTSGVVAKQGEPAHAA